MELALIILAAAVLVGAVILALALRKPAAAPALPDPRLDTLLAKQGEIGGQFTQTVAVQEALARTLGERLEAAGATYEVNIHEGLHHGFMQQTARLAESRRAFELMGDFYRRHLPA